MLIVGFRRNARHRVVDAEPSNDGYGAADDVQRRTRSVDAESEHPEHGKCRTSLDLIVRWKRRNLTGSDDRTG